MRLIKLLWFSLFIFLVLSQPAGADTVYLKNGRSMEGIIKNENDEEVELEIGLGAVKFLKKDVQRVYKSTPEESDIIRQQWQEKKTEQDRRWQERAQEEKKRFHETAPGLPQPKVEEDTTFDKEGPQTVQLVDNNGMIWVQATLNHKEQVSMFLDTGAGIVVIPYHIAKRLWVFDKSGPRIQLVSANGGITNATYALIESIRVQGVEARNVDAAILPENAPVLPGINGGILGMSFLKKFKFTLDSKNKELILEKIR